LLQFSKYLFHVDKETFEIYCKENNEFINYKQIGAHGKNNTFYEDKYNSMMEILNKINRKNGFNEDERAQIFYKTFPSETNKTCKICNEDAITFINFQAAHIISRNNGGLRHIKNFIATCANCNATMGSTDIDVYLDKINRPCIEDLNIILL
jgi:hypothetical protein